MGRPGLPPGVYFRLLLIRYVEGIDSERGIAWRAADSLALRDFWALISNTPRRTTGRLRARDDVFDPQTRRNVFTWVLERLVLEAGLVKGQTIAIDATTLEANARLRHQRPSRHRRQQNRSPDDAGAGLGHRDAHAGRLGAVGSETQEEGL